MYKKIVLAFDGSEDGRAALATGAELASLCQAEVVLLAVLDVGVDEAAAEAYASGTATDEQFEGTKAALDGEAARLRQRGIACTAVVVYGHPPQEIAEQAQQLGADLVVIGHRVHGLWSRLVDDAVGAHLVRDPPCSVLIVPPQR